MAAPVVLRQVASLNRDFSSAGWHVFLSDQQRVWATRVRAAAAAWRGAGETLDADTPAEMRQILSRQVNTTRDLLNQSGART